jgi:hypothetical protein
MGLQLAATLFVCAYLGDYLDDHYPISEKRIYTLIVILAGTVGSIYSVIQQLKRLDE